MQIQIKNDNKKNEVGKQIKDLFAKKDLQRKKPEIKKMNLWGKH